MNFEAAVDIQTSAKAKSGGAYYFKSWSPKTEEIPRRRVQYESGKEDGFADWRNFMKEYLREKNEDEKPVQSASDAPIRHDDIAWTTHVEGARQIHMKKAREVAQAVSTSKELKSAKMFQQRFEISEKYAIVKEPVESKQDNEIEASDETNVESEHNAQMPLEKKQDEAADPNHPTQFELKSDMSLQPNSTTLHNLPGELGFLATPEPWKIKPEAIPPPTYKNFNRSARGFVGSYLTSYY